MLTGLENYKILFMIQILVAEGMLLFRLEHRQHFAVRGCLSAAVLIGISVLYPVIHYNAWTLSLLFLVLFACTLGGAYFCFDEPFGNILCCCIAGYTTQHLAYLIYSTVNDVTQFGEIFGNVIDPYGDTRVVSTNLWIVQVAFYLAIYFLTFACVYEIFDPMLRRNHNLYLGKMGMIALSGLLILADVVTNMITTFYTTGSLISLVLERSYNVLLCLLILTLLYNQLSQKELKDELTGVQYILEQGKKQYALAKRTNELIHVKYHDLKHYRSRIADADEKAELDKVLSDYSVLVHTGYDVLDAILTEKAILCREKGIHLVCMADGSGLSFLKPHHLYSLLGNALDNAIEAVEKLPEEERVIHLYINTKGELVNIHVDNPMSGTLSMRDGLPLTTKAQQDYHGFGTLSIRTIAELYGGGITIAAEEGMFSLDIVLCRG